MILTIIGLSILVVGGLILAFLSMKDYLEERES